MIKPSLPLISFPTTLLLSHCDPKPLLFTKQHKTVTVWSLCTCSLHLKLLSSQTFNCSLPYFIQAFVHWVFDHPLRGPPLWYIKYFHSTFFSTACDYLPLYLYTDWSPSMEYKLYGGKDFCSLIQDLKKQTVSAEYLLALFNLLSNLLKTACSR